MDVQRNSHKACSDQALRSDNFSSIHFSTLAPSTSQLVKSDQSAPAESSDSAGDPNISDRTSDIYIMAYIKEVPDEGTPLFPLIQHHLPSKEELIATDPLPRGVYKVNSTMQLTPTAPSTTTGTVIVAKKTGKLRSIYVWVNDIGLVECIIDPGL